MCGIAGAIDLNGRREFSASRLLAMTGAIAHRGPDDEQIHLEPGVALGARRLSIVDLAGGAQPIANEDGSIWVTQNGEILCPRSEWFGPFRLQLPSRAAEG